MYFCAIKFDAHQVAEPYSHTLALLLPPIDFCPDLNVVYPREEVTERELIWHASNQIDSFSHSHVNNVTSFGPSIINSQSWHPWGEANSELEHRWIWFAIEDRCSGRRSWLDQKAAKETWCFSWVSRIPSIKTVSFTSWISCINRIGVLYTCLDILVELNKSSFEFNWNKVWTKLLEPCFHHMIKKK